MKKKEKLTEEERLKRMEEFLKEKGDPGITEEDFAELVRKTLKKKPPKARGK